MTNHHTKLEDPWSMSSLVIDQKRVVYGQTDRPTCAKQYTPIETPNLIVIYESRSQKYYEKSRTRKLPFD